MHCKCFKMVIKLIKYAYYFKSFWLFSHFENFREFSRISQKPSKQTLILTSKFWPSTSKTVPSFSPQILRVFEGHPQKPSKFLSHSHLILTSKFENFWGSPSKTLKLWEWEWGFSCNEVSLPHPTPDLCQNGSFASKTRKGAVYSDYSCISESA